MKELMRNKSVLLLVLMTVIAGLALAVYGQKARTVIAKWEYKEGVNYSVQNLNELGAEGWEIVGFSIDANINKYYLLKRAK